MTRPRTAHPKRVSSPDLLPLAVRAYAVPPADSEPQATRKRRASSPQRPNLVLVFDTETTVDRAQRLLFGSWRVYRRETCIDEGLIVADDLAPEQLAVLREYVGMHHADTVERTVVPLRLLTRSQFLDQVFWKVAYKARGLVVGFNLPFDLARLGVDWGEARSHYYAGGFSLPLWTYERDGQHSENRHRPRVAIKSLDSKRALIGFTRRQKPDRVDLIPEGATDGEPDPTYVFPGQFLDLRTLAFALTNQSYSLAAACKAFAVEHGKQRVTEHGVITETYIDYNRRDVLATWELFLKLSAEFQRHPIDLAITHTYSPASIGKAYLQAMGITPVLERQPDFPPDVLGYAMAAYYGGRAECRIRKVPVPVVYLDFVSMYPTVCTLMHLWDLLIAERIEVEDATQAVQQLLASVSVAGCFAQEFWRGLVGLVQIVPEGGILPTRASYAGKGSWQIGVNPLTSREPLWYTIADVVASTLLTGKPPRILRALRFIPHGQLDGLQPVLLRGQVPVDPRTTDFFRMVIEERKRSKLRSDLSPEERKRLDAFLKVLANSASYGIFVEMNRRRLASREKAPVVVHGVWDAPYTAEVTAPEDPGSYCFPPFAACIAGAARLMLALLERVVTDAGGAYAFCDTDSMAIVSTEECGLVLCPGGEQCLPGGREAIRALSWMEVEQIRQRFAALSPYDQEAIPGSVLKIEDENLDPSTHAQRQLWCYAISAKRYSLFNLTTDGLPLLRKWSEHGLGHLLSPT